MHRRCYCPVRVSTGGDGTERFRCKDLAKGKWCSTLIAFGAGGCGSAGGGTPVDGVDERDVQLGEEEAMTSVILCISEEEGNAYLERARLVDEAACAGEFRADEI